MTDLDWVPHGWTRETYAAECGRMAVACRAVRPDLADQWAARAAALGGDRSGRVELASPSKVKPVKTH